MEDNKNELLESTNNDYIENIIEDDSNNIEKIEDIIEEEKKEEISETAIIENNEEVAEEILTRKQKRELKLKKRYFFENDIKYRGPLSYRYLRIIAWISFAIGIVLVINEFSAKLLTKTVDGETESYKLIGENLETFFIYLSALSVPLFIIATFSTILNKSKSIKSVMIFYGAVYFGLALGVIFFYYRYLHSVLKQINMPDELIKSIEKSLGNKLEINVFADLFALSIFYFFIMYKPKKIFIGKKLIIFRLFSIIPLLVALLSYLIKVFSNLGYYDIPFAANLFLTTKHPFIYILFIILVFWLKHREKTFIKLGGTKEEFRKFEKSNRNSLTFSILVSILCLVISIIDILLFYVPVYSQSDPFDAIEALVYVYAFGFGNCSGLFIAIPFLLLFSYSRIHKEPLFDIIIILVGIGIVIWAAVETSYDLLMTVLRNAKEDVEEMDYSNLSSITNIIKGVL